MSLPYNKALDNMITPIRLQIPTTKTVKGVVVKTFTDDDEVFNVSWKSKGGTERTVDDLVMVEDTVEVACWFNPKIATNCRIVNLITNQVYEIYTPIENVDMRFQFCQFKCKSINGGA